MRIDDIQERIEVLKAQLQNIQKQVSYATISITLSEPLQFKTAEEAPKANPYAIIQDIEPELLWSGNAGYVSDGIEPNSGASGQKYKFEVKYKDIDNDFPLTYQVWVDLNDNSTYESNENSRCP
jgi:hypothetical protein